MSVIRSLQRPLYLFAGLVTLLAGLPCAMSVEPERREWSIQGTVREALLAIPATAATQPTPVVFAFHGHGGSMRNAARMFRVHELWPEAIAVYMQGLNTPGQLTDPEGRKPGWQKTQGDQQDRDLKFFDAVLQTLQQDYKVDDRRIYSTGHSNGGGFTYLLWAERHDVLAAVAPSGAAAIRLQQKLQPLPMLHVAGDNDPLVKFAWQQTTITAVRRLNGCGKGEPWQEVCTLYPSPTGTPVITLITSQGHRFPQQAPPLIVRFFQQHSRRQPTD